MQTAGLISKKDKIIKCVENGARDINVSIDSLNEKLSDYINGLEGSWKNAIQAISFISNTFPQKDSICALGCVLSKYNIDEIEAILDFATQIGWWLSLVPVHITNEGNPLNFRGYDEYFKFKEEDFPKVEELIKRLKKKKRQGFNLFDSNDYLDSVCHFIKYGQPNWRHKGVCDTPNLYFAILPDGRFAPCCDHRFNEEIYLYDDKFPQIYKSKDFRGKVRNITKNCPGCNFGSFPEMTLSARSISTIKERVLLQLKAKGKGIRPVAEDEIFKIIENIKGKYPIYKEGRELSFRNNKLWPKASNIPKELWGKEE
jgi:MoaA/NifB/PqqE/SkfB family radical SAM enzyme